MRTHPQWQGLDPAQHNITKAQDIARKLLDITKLQHSLSPGVPRFLVEILAGMMCMSCHLGEHTVDEDHCAANIMELCFFAGIPLKVFCEHDFHAQFTDAMRILQAQKILAYNEQVMEAEWDTSIENYQRIANAVLCVFPPMPG